MNKSSDIDRLLNIARATNYALWSALLTVNGLFASIFTASILLNKHYRIFSLGMVVICFISSGMLVKNFRDNKRHLQPIIDVYRMSDETFLAVPQDELNKSIENSADFHDRIERRERLVVQLLFVQAFLIVFFLACQIV